MWLYVTHMTLVLQKKIYTYEYCQLFANPCMTYFITDGGCMHGNKYKTYLKLSNVLKVMDISMKYSLCKKAWMESSAYNLNGNNKIN